MTGMGYSSTSKKSIPISNRTRARGANLHRRRPTSTHTSPRSLRCERVSQSSRFAQAGSLSQDPIGFVGGSNVFSYVTNSPIYWVDPSGQKKRRKFRPKVSPGELLSDAAKDLGASSLCCGGVDIDLSKQCCVKNTRPKPAVTEHSWAQDYVEYYVFGLDENTSCKVCWRRALVPGGGAGVEVGLNHMWFSCPFTEVGLSDLGGGVPGDDGSPLRPLPFTEITLHDGQAEAPDSGCVTISVNACCIARHTILRPTGVRCGPPPMYNCNTFVFEALRACGKDEKVIEKIIELMREDTLVEDLEETAPFWLFNYPM
jgi:hypothetical protein